MATRKRPAASASSNTLSKLEPVLRKLPLKEIGAPSIPVDRLIAEARALAKVLPSTRAALVRVGLDPKLADSLEVRATALAEAQSNHLAARGGLRSVEEIELEAAAIAFRSEMVGDLRFAARADQQAQSQLDAVQEGDGIDDLVQDLRDLSVLFGSYAALLKKAAVDSRAKSKRATELAGALEDIVAERRAHSRTDRSAQELRDRAATYLQQAMREIRAAGSYVFRSRPAMAAKFHSAYLAARRARSARRKENAAKPATPEA